MLSDRSRFQKCATDEVGAVGAEPSATRPLNILIVEDDEQTQRMLGLILARSGHNLVFCSNGIEAVEIVKAQQFDLVFMDVLMPLMDGIEATRRIREWEDGKGHLSIVGLTAIFDVQRGNYRQAGMDDLLSKPFDTAKIFQAIAACQDGKGRVRIEKDSPSETTLEELPILDAAGAMKRLGCDSDAYHELMEEFLLSLPDKYEELLDDLNTGKWDTLCNHAHNLKGLSASLGARRLSRNAADLEQRINEGRYQEAKGIMRKLNLSIQLLRARGSVI